MHDSAQQEVPCTANIIEGSRHFFVSSIAHKIEAILAGIGIGYLPKAMAEKYIALGQLVVIDVKEVITSQDLFMAWKITNKGKGLNKLKALLTADKSSAT